MSTFNIRKSRQDGITNNKAVQSQRNTNITKTLSQKQLEVLKCGGCQLMTCNEYHTCAMTDLAGIDTAKSRLRMKFINACMQGDLEAIRTLVQNVGVMARDPWGSTPLHFVVMVGNREGAKELIRLGADPQATNRGGKSPIRCAEMAGDQAMLAILNAADKNMRH